jgi:uncharacterized secreted protein with C-terminal beta-propeller domain
MRRSETVLGAALLVLVGAAIGAGASALDTTNPPANDTTSPATAGVKAAPALLNSSGNTSVATFESDAAFTAYVQRGRSMAAYHGGFGRPVARPDVVREERVTAMPTMTAAAGDSIAMESGAATGGAAGGGGDAGSQPDRVSGTNVQEQGLGEPDILKTTGSHVFFSLQERRYRWDDDRGFGDTAVISAEDPARPEEVAELDAAGKMLLAGDRVVVIEDDELHGYDVSDPENPTQLWEEDLDSEVVTARLLDGEVYLVTRVRADLDDPCPIKPLDGATVRCTDVYHPQRQVPVDATYTAMRLSPDSGEVADAVSFVGTTDDTAVYMSENALYVTYTEGANRGELRVEFLRDQGERFPDWVTERIAEIDGYNISGQSKRTEADRVVDQWLRTLADEERREVRDELRNDYRDFLTDHQRDLVRTGVVRVGVGDELAVDTVETVPGRPLNQFSMDEHEGTLRITTTIPAAGGAQSANDLYVLDNETLQRQGAAKGMGLNEEVYAVRYVGDTAYVVTFRRVDPFHVVDLSDPSNPEEVGKLRLPGFSSYLHPVDDDHVLGIGEENGRVKAVLFDVSDPSDPTIDDDYVLESRWSAIAESHHAFLMDRKHGVFFLPTSDGGKVFDYTDGELSLETHVDTDGNALRAMYIGDFMYVFGQSELVVVDETTWEREGSLELD